MITEARPDGLMTRLGEKIEADIMVWAAGVKAPEITREFGFETNRLNQIEIKTRYKPPLMSQCLSLAIVHH